VDMLVIDELIAVMSVCVCVCVCVCDLLVYRPGMISMVGVLPPDGLCYWYLLKFILVYCFLLPLMTFLFKTLSSFF